MLAEALEGKINSRQKKNIPATGIIRKRLIGFSSGFLKMRPFGLVHDTPGRWSVQW
jgi:hypothetical protein